MPKKPRIIRPTLHLEERRNVVRDRLLLARQGERMVCWAPALDGALARLIFVEGVDERTVREGGRPTVAMRECADAIAVFLDVPVDEVREHLGLGRSVIWS